MAAATTPPVAPGPTPPPPAVKPAAGRPADPADASPGDRYSSRRRRDRVGADDAEAQARARGAAQRRRAAVRRADDAPAPRKTVAAADDSGGGGDCSITINSIPWSEVWIDGKNTTKHTPVVDYKVPCGKHKLAFKRPDMQIDQTESINVRPGRTSSSATRWRPRTEQDTRAGPASVNPIPSQRGAAAPTRRAAPSRRTRWTRPGATYYARAREMPRAPGRARLPAPTI